MTNLLYSAKHYQIKTAKDATRAEEAADRAENYADVIAQRKAWRAEINELELVEEISNVEENFPYPEETLTEPSSSDIIETSETDINSILGE